MPFSVAAHIRLPESSQNRLTVARSASSVCPVMRLRSVVQTTMRSLMLIHSRSSEPVCSDSMPLLAIRDMKSQFETVYHSAGASGL